MNNNDDKRELSLRDKITSGLAWTYAERIAAQGVGFFISIILARVIAPEQFGTIAIVTVFITICNTFVTGGFGNSLVQKKNADQTDFSTIFYFSGALGLLFYLILFLVAPLISKFYGMHELTAVIRVMALQLPIASINSVQHAYVQKKMIFKKFFFSSLIGTASSAVVGISMAYSGFGIWALVAQYLTSTTMNTIVLLITVGWRPSLVFSKERLKQLYSYGWKVMLSSFIYTMFVEIRTLIIGKQFSTATLAYYNRGNQFPNMIVTNINSSISKVLFPVLANSQDNVLQIKQMTRRAISISTFLICPMLVGLVAVAPTLVPILLTDKWNPAIPFLQILSIGYIFYPIHTANTQAINALGRSDINLKLTIIKRSYELAILLVTVFVFRNAVIIAIGYTVTSFISTFVNSFPNKKLIRYSYIEQLKDIFLPICISLVMGILVYMMNRLAINGAIILCIQIITGAGLYFILSRKFNNDSYLYVKETIYSLLSNQNKNEIQK